jgi:hypothetical protein
VFALAGVGIANYFSDKRETIGYLRRKQDAHTELIRKEYVTALEAMGISLRDFVIDVGTRISMQVHQPDGGDLGFMHAYDPLDRV